MGNALYRTGKVFIALIFIFAMQFTPVAYSYVSPDEYQQFEYAIEYLKQQGRLAEAESFNDLLIKKLVDIRKLPSGTNAITEGNKIVFNEKLFTGYAIPDPNSKARFGSTSQLAQLIVHEMKHVNQSEVKIVSSNIRDIVGDNPAEIEGWATGMQLALDALIKLEYELPAASPDQKKILADRILTLVSDVDSGYKNVREQGYGSGIVLHGPKGKNLNEEQIKNYLEAIKKQAINIKSGKKVVAGNTTTTRDQVEFDRSLIADYQRRWARLQKEKKAILSGLEIIRKGLTNNLAKLDAIKSSLEFTKKAIIFIETTCGSLSENKNKLVRFSRASQGVQEEIQKALDTARGVQCKTQNDVSQIHGLFDQATGFGANLQHMFKEAIVVENRYKLLEKNLLKKGFKPSGFDEFLTKVDTRKDTSGLAQAVEDYQTVFDESENIYKRWDTYKSDLQNFNMQVSKEANNRKLPALIDLSSVSNESISAMYSSGSVGNASVIRLPFTRAQRDRHKDKFHQMREDVNNLAAFISQRKTVLSGACLDNAAVSAAIDDTREANEWAILKLGAINELKEKCSQAVAQGPAQDAGGLRITGTGQIESGSEAFFKATDGAGNQIQGDVSWSVSSDELVAIGENGRVRALKPGRFWILAKKEELKAEKEIAIYELMPDLKGQPAKEALQLLKDRNIKFTLALGDPAPDKDLVGKVQQTDPEQDAKMIDEKVMVKIYAKMDVAVVPQLKGLNITEAKKLLQLNGVVDVGIVLGDPASSEKDVGKVQKSKPRQGSALLPGEKIVLTVWADMIAAFDDCSQYPGSTAKYIKLVDRTVCVCPDGEMADLSGSCVENKQEKLCNSFNAKINKAKKSSDAQSLVEQAREKGCNTEEAVAAWNKRKRQQLAAEKKRNEEKVTYFDRQWMPQSWVTSGNSREVIVNIFETASRLGWAESLATYTTGQADSEITEHLRAAATHIKAIHDNSFGPHKAIQDWKKRQAKLYSLVKNLLQENIQQRARSRKSLPDNIKTAASSLLQALSYQGAGTIEKMENCDSNYFRIGYHTAFAAQALAAAEAGQKGGETKKWVRQVTSKANSHASAVRKALNNLKKVKTASGFCVDMSVMTPLINKASQGSAFTIEKSRMASKAWKTGLNALTKTKAADCSQELAGTWMLMRGSHWLVRWEKKGDRYQGRVVKLVNPRPGVREGVIIATLIHKGDGLYVGKMQYGSEEPNNMQLWVAGDYATDGPPEQGMQYIGTHKRLSQQEIQRLIVKKNAWGPYLEMPGEPEHGNWDLMPNCRKKISGR